MVKRSIEDIKEPAPSLSLPFEEFKNKITQYHMVYNEKIKDLINQNPHLLNEVDHRGYSALHLAAENNHIDVIRLLLSKGVDPNKCDKDGNTALHLAAENNHIDVIRLLLSKGVDPNKCDKDGNTALHLAAENNHIDVIRLLLSKGVDPNKCDKDGNTALHLAAENNHIDVIRLLLSKGVDLNICDKNGNTALHLAAENNHIDVIQLLVSKNVELNKCDINGNTALHLAAKKGLVLMKIFLKKYLGGNEYKFDEIVIDYFEVVKLLLSANNNQPDEAGNHMALHLAAAMDNTDVIQLLVSKNVDLNKCDNDGKTALHFAAKNNHIDVIRLLLSKEVDPNICDKNGKTALHCAIDNRRFEIVEPLSSSDRACLHDAVKNGHTRTIKSFLKKAVEVNICDKDDKIALDLVIKEIIEALLNAGANPEIAYRGKTVLDIALENNYTEVAKLLIERKVELTKLEDSGSEYTEVAPADLSYTPPIKLECKEDITVIGNSSTPMNVDGEIA